MRYPCGREFRHMGAPSVRKLTHFTTGVGWRAYLLCNRTASFQLLLRFHLLAHGGQTIKVFETHPQPSVLVPRLFFFLSPRLSSSPSSSSHTSSTSGSVFPVPPATKTLPTPPPTNLGDSYFGAAEKRGLLTMAKVHHKVSQLHNEIVAYAREVTPTVEENEECERVIHIVRKACFETFGSGVQVSPFGSYANGLATRSSDVDLVITGLVKPDTPEGFFGYKQMRVAQHLQSLEEFLINDAELDLKQVQLIAHAKVPVLKCTTSLGVMIDISINDHTCTKAAMWVLEKVRQHPAVRPICLVLKDFLRRYGLSEVRDGGLGGFALTNVVIAHVLELIKAGAPTSDFGDVLISFFDHFGNVFDSEMQAVCVRRGGVVGKEQWARNGMMTYRRCRSYRSGQRTHRRHFSMYGERWFIENPVTGMDVAQGSYNIHLVRDRFISGFYALTSNAVRKGGERRSMLGLIFSF